MHAGCGENTLRSRCFNPLRWSQLTAYNIAANLRDSELDVESYANALGVSKRCIHVIFEAMGM